MGDDVTPEEMRAGLVRAVWLGTAGLAAALAAALTVSTMAIGSEQAGLRGELAGLRSDMRGELAGLRGEMRTRFSALQDGADARSAEAEAKLDLLVERTAPRP